MNNRMLTMNFEQHEIFKIIGLQNGRPFDIIHWLDVVKL